MNFVIWITSFIPTNSTYTSFTSLILTTSTYIPRHHLLHSSSQTQNIHPASFNSPIPTNSLYTPFHNLLYSSSQSQHIHPCKTWFWKACNRNCKNPVLDAIRTLGTSNRAIYCNLQNICFSLLIDLDILIIISPKIDAPYLWIRPLGLVPLNLAYRLL